MVAQRAAPVGGAETHLTASVAALREAGIEVHLALGEEGPGADGSDDRSLVPGLSDKNPPAETFALLAEAIARVDPELVHIQQLPNAGAVSTARRHAPVVYNIHNHDLVCTSGEKYFRQPGRQCQRPHGAGCIPNLAFRGCAHTRDPRGLSGGFRRTGRALADLRSADAVVGHSRFVLDELAGNGVERAAIVPLFVDPPASVSPPPPDGPIVFAGRVTEGKGVGTFLRAAARVEAAVEIIGDGWWMPKAERLSRRLGIEGRVGFSGWLAREGLQQAYRRARIVVVPSHWPEPFGLVGLEAMAAARPVVGSNGGGIPDWLDDGRNGLLVAPGDVEGMADAFATLLSNPGRCAEMGARGAERVRKDFIADRYVESLAGVYDRATSRWQRSNG